jgi:outer membrane lipase/esterase
MKTFKYVLCALGTALALAGCGGGSSSGSANVSLRVNNVKVVGDSLTDSGTFGFKFSMQGSATEPMLIWTERIAAAYGAPTLCPRYIATGATTVVPNPATAACNSYGVGGGRINFPSAPTSPFSIPQQLRDLAAEKNYALGDLLLVDGGGNDAADLTGAFLGIPTDRGAAFAALVSTLVPAATVSAQLATGTSGAVNLGGLYMTALADRMYDAVKTSALDRGAPRVLVLNIPGITNTPRFLDTLDLVALANGGGAAGATARAQTDAIIRGWIVAFNTRLNTRFAGNANAVVVDFYTFFNDQAANPAKYGLTNVRTPACPVQGVGTDGLALYNAQTCTSTSLSATTPPAGATGGANWWRTYAFSDGFHPTITGYQLLADQVNISLRAAGWL